MHAGKRCCLRVSVLLFTVHTAIAQPAMRLTTADADNLFLRNNLSLLAGNLNISIQNALLIQRRAYPNPVFSASFNARDPENNRWFHTGNTGQKAFAVEQLILLGGKRKADIALARLDAKRAGLELEDLLRSLRRELHNSLYAVHFDQRTLGQYNSRLSVLDTIISAYDVQAAKGNISMKEVVRLKSVYLQLNNDKTELLRGILEQEKKLRVLLQTTEVIVPDIEPAQDQMAATTLSLDSLQRLAAEHRADWQLADLGSEIAVRNLTFQRSLAVPDIIVGGDYDQMGGAFRNQVNLTLGVPLPVWNRNRGGIRAAQAGIQYADVALSARRKEIEAEVAEAHRNMLRSLQEYQQTALLYGDGFDAVSRGITDNFRKRNISILEFVDFFESYNETLARVNRVHKNLAIAMEAVNYVTGYPVYR